MFYWISCVGKFLSSLVIVQCMSDICCSIHCISGDIFYIISEECGIIADQFLPERLENDEMDVYIVGDDTPDN